MTMIRTSPCWDGPSPRRRWHSRAPWRGNARVWRTTWSQINCCGRSEAESLLSVALSKIKLILCDAVGDDGGDDGDVHDTDDDDEHVAPAVWRRGEEGRVPSVSSRLRMIWSSCWTGWFHFKRIWPDILFLWCSWCYWSWQWPKFTWSSGSWVQHDAQVGKHCYPIDFCWCWCGFLFHHKVGFHHFSQTYFPRTFLEF